MTLHDQMAVAETLRPGAFFGHCESMPIRVDESGFTRVDAAGGKPQTDVPGAEARRIHEVLSGWVDGDAARQLTGSERRTTAAGAVARATAS